MYFLWTAFSPKNVVDGIGGLIDFALWYSWKWRVASGYSVQVKIKQYMKRVASYCLG